MVAFWFGFLGILVELFYIVEMRNYWYSGIAELLEFYENFNVYVFLDKELNG